MRRGTYRTIVDDETPIPDRLLVCLLALYNWMAMDKYERQEWCEALWESYREGSRCMLGTRIEKHGYMGLMPAERLLCFTRIYAGGIVWSGWSRGKRPLVWRVYEGTVQGEDDQYHWVYECRHGVRGHAHRGGMIGGGYRDDGLVSSKLLDCKRCQLKATWWCWKVDRECRKREAHERRKVRGKRWSPWGIVMKIGALASIAGLVLWFLAA